MARGVNKAIIVGNLGRDPEVRYSANGNAIANVTVATTDSWKDRQSGERQERTEWHRVVFFNRLAEIAAEYCWAPAAAEERRARHEMIRVLRQRRAAPVHRGSVIRNSMTTFRSKN